MLLTPETKRAVWNIRWRLGATVGLMVASALVALAVREAREARPRYRPQRRAPEVLVVEQPRRVISSLVLRMVEPQCFLGPGALCARIHAEVVACADGSARTCREVAHYLETTPPYPMAAMFFYHQGCKLGDVEACARSHALARHRDHVIDCDVDQLGCTLRARSRLDRPVLDLLCNRGVADACAAMALSYVDEPMIEQTYLVASCQRGGSIACTELARRLAADCDGAACFAPNPAQAAVAATFACEAGFTRHCAPVSR